jgi:hypothetical protein
MQRSSVRLFATHSPVGHFGDMYDIRSCEGERGVGVVVFCWGTVLCICLMYIHENTRLIWLKDSKGKNVAFVIIN